MSAVDLHEDLRRLVVERRECARGLRTAVEAVPQPNLCAALRAVGERLPVAVSVDLATIRVADEGGKLHLVAASGCPTSEVRTRAFEPLQLELARMLVASGALARHAAAVGIQWVDVRWIGGPDPPIGTILVGTRTERRPTMTDLDVLSQVAVRLADKLAHADRSASRLRACSVELARAAEPHGAVAAVNGPVAVLRPREREILDLYADGLCTGEVAELLVISPHTVLTHVKSALRRLGVSSRAEAARLVRANQMLQLL